MTSCVKWPRPLWFLAALAAWLIPVASSATIYRVSPLGSAQGDGVSWITAMNSVQAAIDQASAGDEIWVAESTYGENIVIKSGVRLYGGFAGTEALRSERNPSAHVTIIAPGAGGVVCKMIGCSASTVVDGFTLCAGNTHAGGGLYCQDSFGRVSNNIITLNTASLGGGVYCTNSHMEITRNRIVTNSATNGGGIYALNSWDVFKSNIIASNTAVTSGGGIWTCTWGPFTNNTIVYNSTDGTGGGVYLAALDQSVANCIIASNTTGLVVGAAVVNKVFNNCLFDNTSGDYIGVSARPGDISVDPQFTFPGSGDYHLANSSPCRNAGSNAAAAYSDEDLDQQARISGGRVDIGADEVWQSADSLADAKVAPEATLAHVTDGVVSAAFTDMFYLQAPTRACGIRVESPGHQLTVGMRADVTGYVHTNSDGERYIDAYASGGAGNDPVRPLYIRGRFIGGGSTYFSTETGAGQAGVQSGIGLNNIGLLISTSGVVTESSAGFFYVNSADAIDDHSGFAGVRVLTNGFQAPAAGAVVTVTGVSSTYRNSFGIQPLIRARSASDVTLVQ